MVDEQPRRCGLKRKSLRLARRNLQESCPAAWPDHRVKIDRVDHSTVFRVDESYLDRVSLAHANERPRHFSIEGPIAIGRPACGIEHSNEFLGGEGHVNHGRRPVADRRWQIAGVTNDVRSLDRLGRGVCVPGIGLSENGCCPCSHDPGEAQHSNHRKQCGRSSMVAGSLTDHFSSHAA